MRSALVLTVLSLAAACSGRDTPPPVAGRLAGAVSVSGPVQGAVVTAYAYDPVTGARGAELGHSAPTDETGAYEIELGAGFGPVLLVARGVGATYVEPASDLTVAWDSTAELQAVYVERLPSQELGLDLALGAQVTDLGLTPFSTLAVAYAEGRARAGADFAAALREAHGPLRDLLGLDFWRVTPVDLTAGPAGGWNEAVQLGAELAGLSQLVARMADESLVSRAAITSQQLVEALAADLGDGQLDGKAQGASLSLGTCDGVCHLDPCTLRGTFGEAILTFLGSEANVSGLGISDAQPLAESITGQCQIACGQAFWVPATCSADSAPPTITISGLEEGQSYTGTIEATVRLFDAIRLGDEYSLAFTRADQPLDGFYTITESQPSPQERLLTLTIHTGQLTDGPLKLEVEVADATGRPASSTLTLLTDNSPLGHVYGTVVVSGRVAGARVRIYEFDGGEQGALLGEDVTDDQGRYAIEVAETTEETLLIEATNPQTGDPASYIEASSGTQIPFGATDRVRSVVTGWQDGSERADGMVTPYTHIATTFARGLWIANYDEDPNDFADAVTDAFTTLEGHFDDGGPKITFRSIEPANLIASVPSTLNAQARHALVIVGLGQLAAAHAADSGATTATMNTLSLTGKLALDLGGSFTGGEANPPLWDGQTGAGAVLHGAVPLSSYTTRLDLAIAVLDFVEGGPLAAQFTQLELASLLDRISMDSRAQLYPTGEPGGPFDVVPPGPVVFVSPSPAENQVLRGAISLEAQASDNSALRPGGLAWTGAPAAAITGVLVDDSAGPMGPWAIVGSLDTDAFPEGALTLAVTATDKAGQSTTVTRQLVLDRTSPAVVITGATTPGGPLAEGATTGSVTLTLSGTATDTHLASTAVIVNGGAPVLVTVGAGGNWSVSVNLVNGTNTITIRATDQAGNVGTDTAVFSRDALPPTVGLVVGNVCDQATTLATLSPASGMATSVLLGTCSATVPLQNGASFTRFASDYGFGSPNLLPAWQLQVSDNHTPLAGLVVEGRLTRGAAVLVDWQAIPQAPAGSGFTHVRQLHSGYAAELALVSGTYTLQLRATDGFGNVSPVTTVSWTQTLRAPPIRQRAATADCSATQPSCPAFYNLDNTVDNTHQAIAGGPDLPDGKLWVGSGFIDNPSSVPVRVNLGGAATATYRSGSFHDHPQVSQNASGLPDTCSTNPNLIASHDASSGACVTFPTVEVVDDHPAAFSIFADVQTIIVAGGGGLPLGTGLPKCAGCGASEREIPPNTSIQVYVRSNPFSFLWSFGTPAAVGFGSSLHRTGRILGDWKKCLTFFTPPDYPATPRTCTNWQLNRPVHHLRRAKVTPTVTMVLQSKPASAGAGYAAPIGDNGAGGAIPATFTYRPFVWSTAENGVTPF